MTAGLLTVTGLTITGLIAAGEMGMFSIFSSMIFPALNVTTCLAGTSTGCPVRGLRALRALRTRTSKTPKFHAISMRFFGRQNLNDAVQSHLDDLFHFLLFDIGLFGDFNHHVVLRHDAGLQRALRVLVRFLARKPPRLYAPQYC